VHSVNMSPVNALFVLLLISTTVLVTNASKNQRSALVNLVKTLSGNLQTTLNRTALQIEELQFASNVSKLSIEELQENQRSTLDSMSTWRERLEILETDTKRIESTQTRDQTLLDYNQLVCNATIEEARKDLEEKIKEVEKLYKSAPAPTPEPINNQTSQSTNGISGTLDLLNNLDGFLEDYDDYYYASMYDENSSSKPETTPKFERLSNVSSVSTLLGESNRLLRLTDQQYRDLENQVAKLDKRTDKVEKLVSNTALKEEINSRINRLAIDNNMAVKRLEKDIGEGDRAVRKELELKVEDVELLKKITNSRLSVYEKRLESLERLMENVTASLDSVGSNPGVLSMDQLLRPSAQDLEREEVTTSRANCLHPPCVSTTEGSRPDHSVSNELDNLANMMLSNSQPPTVNRFPETNEQHAGQPELVHQWRLEDEAREAEARLRAEVQKEKERQDAEERQREEDERRWRQEDLLRTQGNSAYDGNTFNDNLYLPPPMTYDASKESKDEFFARLMGGGGGVGTNNGNDIRGNENRGQRRGRSGRKLSSFDDDYPDSDGGESDSQCDCSLIKERLNILESGFENMVTEVETQMAGIQSSVTEMLHRMQKLEAADKVVGQRKPTNVPACVATKEASAVDGIDEWCRDQCPGQYCSSALCSCPPPL